MAYTNKRIWSVSEIIQATYLNNIEGGIDDAHIAVDAHIADSAKHLTANEKDALTNASAPTSLNPLVTTSDIVNEFAVHAADTSTHGVTGDILGSELYDAANGVPQLTADKALELFADGRSQIRLLADAGGANGGSIHTYTTTFFGTEILANAYYTGIDWYRFNDLKPAYTMLLDPEEGEIAFYYAPAGAGAIGGTWDKFTTIDKDGILTTLNCILGDGTNSKTSIVDVSTGYTNAYCMAWQPAMHGITTADGVIFEQTEATKNCNLGIVGDADTYLTVTSTDDADISEIKIGHNTDITTSTALKSFNLGIEGTTQNPYMAYQTAVVVKRFFEAVISGSNIAEVIINPDLDNIDFRVQGDNDSDLLVTDAGNDRIGIGTTTPLDKLTVEGGIGINDLALTFYEGATPLRWRKVSPPTTAIDTGTEGDFAQDINYIYVCVSTDTWKRTALSTW